MARGGKRFTTSDVKAMLRLCDDLHTAAPDAAARTKLLLDGLCRLVGASAGQSIVFDAGRHGRRPVALAAERTGHGARTAGDGVGPSPDQPPAIERPRGGLRANTWPLDLLAPTGDDDHRRPLLPLRSRACGLGTKASGHCLRSCVALAGSRVRACLTLQRRRPAPRFTARDRAVVDVIHSSMKWVYHADVLLASPELLELSPRQRQTLQHLLTGQSEKQIAARMHLSPNTVHHYVKALHRHFGVSSRK